MNQSCHTRLTVAVAGSSEKHVALVARRCEAFAKVVFVDARRARTDYPGSIEFVLLTRFIPHRASVAARGIPRKFCRGGLESQCRIIAEAAAGLRPRDDHPGTGEK